MTAVVLGVDLSSTAAGAAWVDFETGDLVGSIVIRPRGSTADRCHAIGVEVAALVNELEPLDVWAEAIGTRHVATGIAMGRVHQSVFERLGARTSVGEVSPAEVKRFATGSGTATKAAMVAAAVVRWPGFAGSDHEADAAFVAAFGRSRVLAAMVVAGSS